MQFRTVIEPLSGQTPIDHSQHIVMLGSCFTDNVGARLARDGFTVSVNAMGTLYNPASIARCVTRALERRPYTADDLVLRDGIWHCLDYESRRQGTDPEHLLAQLNGDFTVFCQTLARADVMIVTFGTAWVFEHVATGRIAGNCHKLRADEFVRRRMTATEIAGLWEPIAAGRRIIFTVSPIRHLADGLHGNALSKATLLTAIDAMGAEYFPSFEIMNDDLRDYRFYAADMKHPSEVAVDYIYDLFGQTYFSARTQAEALQHRREYARSQHRPIIG